LHHARRKLKAIPDTGTAFSYMLQM